MAFRPCRNPDCQYPANPDPQVSVDFCCEKCEGRFNGEAWATQGKKKHTAYCSSNSDGAEVGYSAQDSGYGAPSGASYSAPGAGYGGPSWLYNPMSSGGPAYGSHSRGGSHKTLEKCANPRCTYLENSDPSISFRYCCEKCEGADKGEAWAEGGKKHYKTCEKIEADGEAMRRASEKREAEFCGQPAPEIDARSREPLERHRGAQRDTRPAWMTKGCGINTEMFGETKGDMLKPGLTRDDLEKLERAVRSDSPDPMRDFLNTAEPLHRSRSRSPARRAPLPDQQELYWSSWDSK